MKTKELIESVVENNPEVRELHPTILKNINRKKKFVDDRVQLFDDGLPMFSWLELSPVDMCNRSCVFCPRNDKSIAPNQRLYMPRKLYEGMAQELAEIGYEGTVVICGYGEPMLHKDVYIICKKLSEASGALIQLIDKIRRLDNDIIRLRSKLNTIITLQEQQKKKKKPD